jgi:SHS family sialic acid transporter-like MFS transporter
MIEVPPAAAPGPASARRGPAPLAAPAPAFEEPSRRDRWMALVAAFLGWLFDGFEMGLFPVLARPALRSMLPGGGEAAVGTWMSWITACFLGGAAAGGFVFGWIGDRVGRVRALSLSILTYAFCTGLGYFVTAPWQLGACRAIAALGMGGEWALGVALVMETWPDRYRPRLAGAMGAAGNLGYVVVAVVAAAIPVTQSSWRWMMLVGAAPAVLVFFIRRAVPESRRWQRSVAAGAARPLREIFAPPLRRRTLVGIGVAGMALVGSWGSVQWIPLWVDQITGGQRPEAKAIAQMLSMLGAATGGLLAPLVAQRLGRRRAFFVFCLLALAATAVLFRVMPERYGPALLGTIALTGVATATFYGWFPLYLPELFPTRVRATGQGVCYNAGRVLAIAGTLLQGRLVAAFDGRYAAACATITLVYGMGLVLVWLGPETHGRELPG